MSFYYIRYGGLLFLDHSNLLKVIHVLVCRFIKKLQSQNDLIKLLMTLLKKKTQEGDYSFKAKI